MSLWVVVGGQFGSEGKGKIAAFLAQQYDIDIAIRCGGPNSGHSFVDCDGETRLLRQLPTAYINRNTRLLIPAGALVDPTVLRNEIEAFQIPQSRVGVDRRAMIIEENDKESERTLGLRDRLSSTLCGVGAAMARRTLRGSDVRLAKDAVGSEPWLRPLLTDVAAEANRSLSAGEKVLIEGTQGFGLSLFHSEYYPKTTSRDTTAAGFLSEVGVSPLLITDIVLVLRTFPIRVSGSQAGPLRDEISWDVLREEASYPYPIVELTSVTKKVRRVGRFDWDLAERAALVNRPTKIAVNCVDHLGFANRGKTDLGSLTRNALVFLAEVQTRLSAPVSFVGTGPSVAEVFRCGSLKSELNGALDRERIAVTLGRTSDG